MTDIIAQGLGIVGAALNIGSFQMKKNKTLITFQFLGSSFFLFNYLMLGALTGCFLNGMGVIRGLIFMQGKKLRKLPIPCCSFGSRHIVRRIYRSLLA